MTKDEQATESLAAALALFIICFLIYGLSLAGFNIISILFYD